jgi:hypothetical protein
MPASFTQATSSSSDNSHQDPTCPPTEKCDYAEAIAGVALIVTVDLSEAVFLIVATAAAGPMAAVGVLEATAPIWVPVNAVGVYFIFDSGVVRDFNRTAWGWKK